MVMSALSLSLLVMGITEGTYCGGAQSGALYV